MIQMISPPVYVFTKDGANTRAVTVLGWVVDEGLPIVPVVPNPDGPGIGPWSLYYGEDPWSMSS